jgi:organic radical activating enzyme
MIIFRKENKTIFDTKTGILCRGIEKKPSAPELIDLKVTNKCEANCDFCYMSSHKNGKHADLDWITQQLYSLPTRPLQIAVGGGEPTLWPDLLTFVYMCRALGIVVNTAVGPNPNLNMLRKITRPNHMGAVGISYVNEKRFEKVLNVAKEGDSTLFAHCILRSDKMQEWIDKANKWPKEIAGIIFLLFKPCGKAKDKTELIPTQEQFEKLIEAYKKSGKEIGFDSCTSELLKGHVEEECIDACDGGQYSLFVDGANQTCGPCSFLPTEFDLSKISLNEAWQKIERIKNCKFALRRT